ncbi:hypothetical protein N657DRAFT_644416 [Parathielavia appendiculata]|uniref:PH domain-containing protein n=1 Tax=Parathielavia appendiculata TaxID=2587402 RepID=A0AAN6Z4T9_9PEZI|nr:hypothetical protein N657DRAFT_644416 [Parathielavia appendiculata]
MTSVMSTAKTAVNPMLHSHGHEPTSSLSHQQAQPTYHPGATDVDALPHTYGDPSVDYGNTSISPVGSRPTRFTEEWDASQRGSSIVDGPGLGGLQRSTSYSGHASGVRGDGATTMSRGNTLRKKASLRKSASLKRSGSRRSMKAGSVRSLALQSSTDQDEMHSAFYSPVPTGANPTEVLATRFQAWRKILKDLITYFRELQTHYEHRAKSLLKLSNVLNNTATPPGFLASGGLDDALQILRGHNKQAIAEANKAREIEEDVILALTGLRSDLQQKIKEIKNLSGDFKNSVDKEMENTRRAVNQLQEALGQTELDPSLTVGKQDPYLLRLIVDRQLERQIDEENYLHQAYLNLENSGKELESIVVGEIQKAYNAYAGILKRESDAAYNAIEELRTGPISMPKDGEWTSFIQRDDRFVNPDLPMRSAETIHYPGRDHYACREIRAGLLERKSKYLKSYTPGWYVLSPTHLHEYKSADKTQAPVMSLYLPEQKLGSHSAAGSSSNKFVLKGRQIGTMHRGHKWVFRAESYDTMMAWYEDIKVVTERTPEERNNLVRANSRSISRSSQRSSVSSDGVEDVEEPPFTTTAASVNQQQPRPDSSSRRPSGGRFPSDLQVNAQRGLHVPVSPVSVSSGSFNQQYPFATSVSPSSEFGQYPHGSQEAGRARGSERGDLQHASTADGLAEGSVPFPSSVAAAAPQRHRPMPQEPGRASVSSATRHGASSLDTRYEGPIWAEPVPIPPPQQHQPIFPTRNGAASEAYDSQGAATTMSGGRSTKNAEPKTSHGGGVAVHGVSRGMTEDATAAPPRVMVRTDSVPTISHLHVPGEYPNGSYAAAP